MTSPQDARHVWDAVNAHVRDRWLEHVQDALPERLIDAATDGPVEELPD